MKRFQTAFTLLELMITVVVLVIMVTIAAPSFTALIANNRSVTAAQDVINSIRVARSEAIKRGARVTMCASTDGNNCGGDWNSGWIIFVDAAASDVAAPVVDSSQRIKYFVANSGAVIYARKNAIAQSYIRFTSQGLLARAANDLTPVIIDIQQNNCTGQSAREIQLSLAGNVAVLNQNCS